MKFRLCVEGDKGYCFIPYPYLSNPEHCSDVYTIKKLTNFDLQHDHWLDDPSEMKFSIPTDLGANENDEEDDWKVIDEPLASR